MQLPKVNSLDEAVTYLAKADPVMAGLIQRVGPCRLASLPPTFETLARSITFQQLHGKAAKAIFDRLKKAAGRRFTASAFMKLSDDQLRACGLSRQKLASLQDLASRVQHREISFRKLASMQDEDVISALCEVRGIGVWTVQMFLMFALNRPDVLPILDLGIRSAVRKAYGLGELPKPSELAIVARDWHPYCTVASWYLWRSLDNAALL